MSWAGWDMDWWWPWLWGRTVHCSELVAAPGEAWWWFLPSCWNLSGDFLAEMIPPAWLKWSRVGEDWKAEFKPKEMMKFWRWDAQVLIFDWWSFSNWKGAVAGWNSPMYCWVLRGGLHSRLLPSGDTDRRQIPACCQHIPAWAQGAASTLPNTLRDQTHGNVSCERERGHQKMLTSECCAWRALWALAWQPVLPRGRRWGHLNTNPFPPLLILPLDEGRWAWAGTRRGGSLNHVQSK